MGTRRAMRARNLGIGIGMCGAFALWPTVAWLGAQFGVLDDRWFASLEALTFTFPIALGAAAVLFALHGLVLNSTIAAELEERFATDLAPTASGGGVGVVAGAPLTGGSAAPRAGAPVDETAELPVTPDAAAADGKPALGGKMAVAPRPQGFKAGKPDKKGKKVAKVGRQVKQRAGYKAKNAVTRGIRERIGLRF